MRLDKRSDVEYRYALLFESPLYRLLDKLFTHLVTGLSTFTVSRTLKEWVGLVVECANGIDLGWSLGDDIPETEPKNLSFEGTSCRKALNKLVVEFFLVGKTIHREYGSRFKTLPEGMSPNIFWFHLHSVLNEANIQLII